MVDSIDTVRSTLVASLNSIITDAETKSATLRTQRTALQAQIQDLNAQITTLEGTDATEARDDLQQLTQFTNRRQSRMQQQVARTTPALKA